MRLSIFNLFSCITLADAYRMLQLGPFLDGCMGTAGRWVQGYNSSTMLNLCSIGLESEERWLYLHLRCVYVVEFLGLDEM